jgi:hypothetical protein
MSTMSRDSTKQAVLHAMRVGGEALTLAFEDGKPVWRLMCSGRRISAKTAQRVANCADVQSSDDALFSGMPAQTYRRAR